MKNRLSLPVISILCITVILFIVTSNTNWHKGHWKSIIEADAKGYYAYLPAVFIYHDLNLGFFDSIENGKYYNRCMFYDYRTGAHGKTINKYYCGTALAQLPFFLVAHAIAHLTGADADGYSKIYPVCISIAAIIYLITGLIYFIAVMKHYNLSPWTVVFTLFATVFGTNLFYYTVGEPALSHIYSFAFITMFFYYSVRYFSTPKPGYITVLGALLGIIILIRPVNGLIIFIWPFAAGGFRQLRDGLATAFKHTIHLSSALFLCVAIISIQLILYKISTGHFFVYSYGGEGFVFTQPHIADILFSYKKGLFLYTPMYLLAFTGLYFIRKISPFSFYSWLLFFLLITYVFSSWWNWYYGGSFSSRVYVEFLSLFMLLLAVTLQNIRKKAIKYVYITLIGLFIIICQVQTYQYRYYYIHWENMTKEKYWDVFMRVDKLIK